MDNKHQCNALDLEEIARELHSSDSKDDSNESMLYQDYFSYATEMLGLIQPISWRDALALYHRLLAVAH
jgi:hypothetical protein